VLVNGTRILLETTPYSEYNVSVTTKPADYGIWSSSVSTSFKTLAAGMMLWNYNISFWVVYCFCLATSLMVCFKLQFAFTDIIRTVPLCLSLFCTFLVFVFCHMHHWTMNIQGAAKKVIPYRILQIFKQPFRIFWWNFAVIFPVHSDIQLPNNV